MESTKDIIMHDIKREVMLEVLKTGERMDGRKFDEYRKVKVQRNIISSAEGSALAQIGTTQVLCGMKVDVLTPFPDRPEEGVLITNAEFPPLASPTFESGPPDEHCIELARVVDRGIRSAECIDLESLYLEEGKVLGIFLDIYVLDHGGNMIDAAALAALASLIDAKIPKYEDGALIRDEVERTISLTSYPIATTFAQIDEFVIADPTFEENQACDSKITITTREDEKVCAVQKSRGKFSIEKMDELVDLAFKKGNELRRYVKEE